MSRPDDLQYKMDLAVQSIGDAEAHENAGDLHSAIKLYEEGAHLLSQAGFPHEKIAEIYNRISILKETVKQKELEAALAVGEVIGDAEDRAFSLIDQAEIALKGSDIASAIKYYEAAMPLLEKAGYTIQHVQDKLQELRARQPPPVRSPGVMKPAGVMKPVATVKPVKPAGAVKPPAPVVPSPFPPESPSSDAGRDEPSVAPPEQLDTREIDDFMASRGKIDEMEDKAFSLVDQAKMLTEQEKYSEALHLYGIIKNLLKNAGWSDDQLEPVLIQESLVKEIVDERAAAISHAPASLAGPGVVPAEPDVPVMVRRKLDMFLDQDTRMRTFKAAQSSRQSAEAEAFDLINEAQRLYKYKDIDRDYAGAMGLYQQAMRLLARAGWTDQVEYLEKEIDVLRGLHAREASEKERVKHEARLVAEHTAIKEQQAIQKQIAVEDNLKSISAMLGHIDAQQKIKQQEAREQSIKQQLLEEKRYKELVAKTAKGKSLDSLKDMLFSDKDSKAEAEKIAMKQRLEQEFLSSGSKRYFAIKKESKEAGSPSSLETVVDIVHSEAVASKSSDTPRVRFTDLREKQAWEMKQEQNQKEEAMGDVMALLGSLKKKDTAEPAKKPEPVVQDQELKDMFSKLKKTEK